VRVLSSRDGAFTIEVDMGRARVLDPSPVRVDTNAGRFEVWNVRVGNPHAVLFLERALDTATAEHVAARVRAHTEHWPEGANVEFVTRGPSGFQVQVHERGVGWTRACGTGACAVAWAAVRAGLAEAGKGALAVHLQGGALSITCDPVSAHEAQVTMSGPARRVFTGEIEIEGETEAAS
jgi:diaminopimelate epimerase